MSQPAEPSRFSQRTFFRLSSGLLTVTAIGAPAGQADAASSATGKNRSTNLAGFRPIQVSSTDYAPTPGDFAVDGISAVGSPAGTGWRAAAGDSQWISVDLQAVCRVDAVGLVFEATRDTPPAMASSTDDPSRRPENAFDRDPTTRWSSAYQDNQWLQVDLGSVIDVDRVDLTWEPAIAKTFAIETSTDGTTWTTAQSVTVGGLHLARLELHDATSTALSDNTYWNYTSPQDLQALNALPPAQLAVTVLQRSQAGDRTTVTVGVQNTGAAVAPMVVPSLRANGERVLPTIYSDNYLWLLPAESRDIDIDIDIDCATTDLGSHSPAVQVTAYGATPTTVSA